MHSGGLPTPPPTRIHLPQISGKPARPPGREGGAPLWLAMAATLRRPAALPPPGRTLGLPPPQRLYSVPTGRRSAATARAQAQAAAGGGTSGGGGTTTATSPSSSSSSSRSFATAAKDAPLSTQQRKQQHPKKQQQQQQQQPKQQHAAPLGDQQRSGQQRDKQQQQQERASSLAVAAERESLQLLEWPELCRQVGCFAQTPLGAEVALRAKLRIGGSQGESERLLQQATEAREAQLRWVRGRAGGGEGLQGASIAQCGQPEGRSAARIHPPPTHTPLPITPSIPSPTQLPGRVRHPPRAGGCRGGRRAAPTGAGRNRHHAGRGAAAGASPGTRGSSSGSSSSSGSGGPTCRQR